MWKIEARVVGRYSDPVSADTARLPALKSAAQQKMTTITSQYLYARTDHPKFGKIISSLPQTLVLDRSCTLMQITSSQQKMVRDILKLKICHIWRHLHLDLVLLLLFLHQLHVAAMLHSRAQTPPRLRGVLSPDLASSADKTLTVSAVLPLRPIFIGRTRKEKVQHFCCLQIQHWTEVGVDLRHLQQQEAKTWILQQVLFLMWMSMSSWILCRLWNFLGHRKDLLLQVLQMMGV